MDQCENIPSHDQCSYSRDNCETDAIFSVFNLYFCTFEGYIPSLIVILLILLICFYILGSTADDYMSPALNAISSKLNLSPNLAGVTLLAFGNGAPDLMSSLAAASNNQVQMAIGALCGAGIFVTCFVVGACVQAMSKEEKLPLGPFLRDIVYYMIAIIMLGICSLLGYFHLFFAFAAILYYAIFVIQVLCQEKKAKEFQKLQKSLLENNDTSEVSLQDAFNENSKKSRNESFISDASEISFQSEPSFSNLDEPTSSDQITLLHHEIEIIENYIDNPITKIKYQKGKLRKAHSIYGFVEWNYFTFKLSLNRRARLWQNQDCRGRIFSFLMMPLILFRELTIPYYDNENWNRTYCYLNPLFIMIFQL